MNICYLLLGSNLEDPGRQLSIARKKLRQQAGKILRKSSLYQTAAWGKTDQPDFLNQVVEMETQLSPRGLLETLLAIEAEMGRLRTTLNAPRIIDIDILYYNNIVLHEDGLSIPHRSISERRFVLVPLTELEPGMVHPVSGLTNAEMLARCPDPLDVKRI